MIPTCREKKNLRREPVEILSQGDFYEALVPRSSQRDLYEGMTVLILFTITSKNEIIKIFSALSAFSVFK